MMKKPPRGLTDKDMIKNYVEEKSVEAQLLTAAKKAEKRRLADAADAPPEPLAKAGFTKDLTEKLGMELLALKMQLEMEGVKGYDFKIKRDSEKITLNVVDKKF